MVPAICRLAEAGNIPAEGVVSMQVSCRKGRNKLISLGIIGRGEKIRTSGPCLPKAVLYQAELHPEPRAIIHLDTIVGKKSSALWGNCGGNSLQHRLCMCHWRISIRAALGAWGQSGFDRSRGSRCAAVAWPTTIWEKSRCR